MTVRHFWLPSVLTHSWSTASLLTVPHMVPDAMSTRPRPRRSVQSLVVSAIVTEWTSAPGSVCSVQFEPSSLVHSETGLLRWSCVRTQP